MSDYSEIITRVQGSRKMKEGRMRLIATIYLMGYLFIGFVIFVSILNQAMNPACEDLLIKRMRFNMEHLHFIYFIFLFLFCIWGWLPIRLMSVRKNVTSA